MQKLLSSTLICALIFSSEASYSKTAKIIAQSPRNCLESLELNDYQNPECQKLEPKRIADPKLRAKLFLSLAQQQIKQADQEQDEQLKLIYLEDAFSYIVQNEKLSGESAYSNQTKASVQLLSGQFLEALVSFEKALRGVESLSGDQKANLYCDRAVLFTYLARWKEAAESFDLALENNPSKAEAQEGRGVLAWLVSSDTNLALRYLAVAKKIYITQKNTLAEKEITDLAANIKEAQNSSKGEQLLLRASMKANYRDFRGAIADSKLAGDYFQRDNDHKGLKTTQNQIRLFEKIQNQQYK